jgi:hypothetical protein
MTGGRARVRCGTYGVMLVLLASSALHAQTQCTDFMWKAWTGATNQFYNTATNWDPAGPPCNAKGWCYGVRIDNGRTVNVDSRDCSVTSLRLGADSTFKVLTGNRYSVLRDLETSGLVWANGGNFSAVQVTNPQCKACFRVDGGVTLSIVLPVYCATALNTAKTDYTLLSSDGAGSLLNLKETLELNDGFANKTGWVTHKIVAQNRGKIDLSGLTKITGPGDVDDSLSINANSGGSIDLSSLQTITGSTGGVSFTTAQGGTLLLGNVTAAIPVTITLQDSADLLLGVGDLNWGEKITISNPGNGSLMLKGDFTYSHKNATRLPFGKSCVLFEGQGPQELEVGGKDVGASRPADDNFGFGRMVVGDPNRPVVVLLVDRVDNGNRVGGGAEALYLFGQADPNDPTGARRLNGLQLLGGSTLYLGGLKVYALLDGILTDLSTLFDTQNPDYDPRYPDQVKFGGGYLCRGGPDVSDCRNLIRNGNFESGANPPTEIAPVRIVPAGSTDLTSWEITQNTINWTHETAGFPDAGPGECFADLSSSTAGKGAVSQILHTKPQTLYHVWFDVACHPSGNSPQSGLVTVSAAGRSEQFRVDPPTGQAGPVPWQTRTWRFVATEPNTVLTFAAGDDASTPFSVALDNVIVMNPNSPFPPDCFRLKDWSLSTDTGADPNDQVTNDPDPNLTLIFSKEVWGNAEGVALRGPSGPVDATIWGWSGNTLKVRPDEPLAKDGQYTLTLKNTLYDLLGEPFNNGVHDTILSFTFDTTPPDVNACSLLTRDPTPLLTGSVGDPNAQVKVTLAGPGDANQIWGPYLATNNHNGTWTLPDDTIQPALSDGLYDVNAVAIDRAGNAHGITRKCLTVDTNAPKVTVDDCPGANDPSPELMGTVDDPQAVVQVTISEVGAGLPCGPYPAVNDGQGRWKLPGGTITPPLTGPAFDAEVTATDRAGNVGTARAHYRRDITPPEVTAASVITSDPTPELTGTVDDPDATLTVSITVHGKTDPAGGPYAARNNRDGTWTLPDNKIEPPLTDGVYDVNVTAADLAGNVGLGLGSLTIDRTPPGLICPFIGTSYGSPELSGMVDDPDATVLVTIKGRSNDGESVSRGPYVAVNNRDGTWTLPADTIQPDLPLGRYSVLVTATDRAGNTSTCTGGLEVSS